jgi:hypothetical protein
LETNDNNNIINSVFSGNFRQKEKFIIKKEEKRNEFGGFSYSQI